MTEGESVFPTAETEPKTPEWKGFIEVGKTRTYLELHGPGWNVIKDESGKDKIVFDKGVTPIFICIGGADIYRYQPFDRELVNKLRCPTVGFDPPGQTSPQTGERGRSSTLKDADGKPLKHTMKNYAQFQRDLITTLVGESRPVNIVAMSMGGVPAMMLAGEYPELVKNLILVGSFLNLKDNRALAKIKEIGNLKNNLGEAINIFIDSLRMTKDDARTAKKFFNLRIPPNQLLALSESFMDLLFSADATDYAKRISAPTLIIAGTADNLAPVGGMRKVKDAIRWSKMIMVNSGHKGVLGNSQEVNQTSVWAIIKHFSKQDF